MAQSGRIVERIAERGHINPSSVLRRVRVHRAAGQVPVGEIGGSQKHGHFEPDHLGALILGFGASQPADAAEVAAALRGYVFYTSNPVNWVSDEGIPSKGLEQTPHFGGRFLGDALEEAIDRAARCFLDPARFLEVHTPGYLPSRLVLAPDTGRARIFWTVSDQTMEERVDEYIACQPTRDPTLAGRFLNTGVPFNAEVITTQTHIAPPLIIVAGELWADTQARRSGALPFPSSSAPTTSGANEGGNGNSSTGAQPKTENGANGALPGATAAPSNNSVQPRANGTSSSHIAENRETEAKPQGLSSSAELDTPSHPSTSRHPRPGVQPHAFSVP